MIGTLKLETISGEHSIVIGPTLVWISNLIFEQSIFGEIFSLFAQRSSTSEFLVLRINGRSERIQVLVHPLSSIAGY